MSESIQLFSDEELQRIGDRHYLHDPKEGLVPNALGKSQFGQETLRLLREYRQLREILNTEKGPGEYQQVAALVCMNIDLLLGCLTEEDLTLEKLISLVRFLHKKKEEIIHNPEIRRSRYTSASLLWSLVDRSQVLKSTPLPE